MPKRKLSEKEEEEIEDSEFWEEVEEKWKAEHPEQSEEVQEEEVTEEETEPSKPTIAEKVEWERQEQEDDIREKKLELLAKLEKQIDESEKADSEISDLKAQLTEQVRFNAFWLSVLENPNYAELLRTYVKIIQGLIHGMADESKITVTVKDGKINFQYEFFDKNGVPIVTEFDNVEGSDEDEAQKPQ